MSVSRAQRPFRLFLRLAGVSLGRPIALECLLRGLRRRRACPLESRPYASVPGRATEGHRQAAGGNWAWQCPCQYQKAVPGPGWAQWENDRKNKHRQNYSISPYSLSAGFPWVDPFIFIVVWELDSPI